jgi:hypothetical protein
MCFRRGEIILGLTCCTSTFMCCFWRRWGWRWRCGLGVGDGSPPSPYVLRKFFEIGDLGPDLGFRLVGGVVCFGWGLGGGVLSSWVVLICCAVEVLAGGWARSVRSYRHD